MINKILILTTLSFVSFQYCALKRIIASTSSILANKNFLNPQVKHIKPISLLHNNYLPKKNLSTKHSFSKDELERLINQAVKEINIASQYVNNHNNNYGIRYGNYSGHSISPTDYFSLVNEMEDWNERMEWWIERKKYYESALKKLKEAKES